MEGESDKERRKRILREVKAKEREAFYKSLPLDAAVLRELFEFLDENLEDCDHGLTLTMRFLNPKGIADPSPVLQWLKDNGGYCDCEVLANVEQKFD